MNCNFFFQKTDMSEALTEICKMDPDFSKEEFLKKCENDIIPNILEAMVHLKNILIDFKIKNHFNLLFRLGES